MKNAILILAGLALFFVTGTLVGGMIQLPRYCDPSYLILCEILIGAYVVISLIVSFALIISTVRDIKFTSIGVLALFFTGLIPGILYLVWKANDANTYDGSFYKTKTNRKLSEDEINKKIDDLDEMKLRGVIGVEEYNERKEKLLRK